MGACGVIVRAVECCIVLVRDGDGYGEIVSADEGNLGLDIYEEGWIYASEYLERYCIAEVFNE